jgi:LmbE family N-acetylglucosaminyl deacetylase
VVDISESIERKIAAMQLHYSQVADPQRLAGLLRDMAQATADGTLYEYAETYHYLRFGERNVRQPEGGASAT